MTRSRLGTILLALTLTLCASAAQAQRPADHEAAVRALFDEAWSAGDFSGLDRILSPDLQFHFGGRSRPMATDRFQGMVTMWRTAFPDLKFVIEDVVSSGDRVAARFTFTGTHQGRLMDLAPTGRTVDVDLMAFFRFADGRIVDMWETYNESRMRTQLAPPEQ